MPLGMNIGHIVLHADPASPATPHKGHSSPIFGPYLLWSSGRPSQLLLSTCILTKPLVVLILLILNFFQ